MNITKSQRLVVWLMKDGKTLRRRNGSCFFTDREHITINKRTIDWLINLDLISAQGHEDDYVFDYALTKEAHDYIGRSRWKPAPGMVYGGNRPNLGPRGCHYCLSQKSRKSARGYPCEVCGENHRICRKCGRRHLVVRGEFPGYKILLKCCLDLKKKEAAGTPAAAQGTS